MRTNSTNDNIYIGRKAGVDILRQIKNSKKSVKIVSPYLSTSYIQELINLHNKGIKITLITADKISDESRYSDFKVSDLITTKKIPVQGAKSKKNTLKIISLAFFLVSLLTLTLTFLFSQLIFISAFLFLISLVIFFSSYFVREYNLNYTPIFRIKVFDSTSGNKPWSTELVHSKIFIIDEDVCFLGSANFTFSGFETHYETVIKVQDNLAVSAISEEIEKLFNSAELRAKSVEEWAGV